MKNKNVRGVVVFYVDVGSFPTDETEKCLESVKNSNSDNLSKIPEDVLQLWFPIRHGPSRVEWLPLK